ncbi:hypothetical protein DPMN_052666 [Dreissena polymorpha]|uniref:Uncharacterized protein n=1 Tax=Dreissena polymorpha TaxID=45954 RepID=A0A9D4CLA8_DREPO|nr:hypothetical protein DPMN_052666 [Dreissena polymorpha]
MREWKDDIKQERDVADNDNSAINGVISGPSEEGHNEANNNEADHSTERTGSGGTKKPGSEGKVGLDLNLFISA